MRANISGVSLADRYQRSTELMRAKLNYPEHIKEHIIRSMIRVCEQARKYEWPEIEKREQDKQALDDAEQQAKHARSLAKYLARHPTQNIAAVRSAQFSARVYLRTGSPSENEDIASAKRQFEKMGKPEAEPVAFSQSISLWLSRLLAAYADELGNKRLLARAGPMSHRNHLGPLWFAQPIEKGRGSSNLPDAETCLAIYLSFLFKIIAPDGSMRWGAGQRIPKDGEPRWPLVSALVCDATGTNTDEKDLIAKAKKRIHSNPCLGIVGYEWGDARPKK